MWGIDSLIISRNFIYIDIAQTSLTFKIPKYIKYIRVISTAQNPRPSVNPVSIISYVGSPKLFNNVILKGVSISDNRLITVFQDSTLIILYKEDDVYYHYRIEEGQDDNIIEIIGY